MWLLSRHLSLWNLSRFCKVINCAFSHLNLERLSCIRQRRVEKMIKTSSYLLLTLVHLSTWNAKWILIRNERRWDGEAIFHSSWVVLRTWTSYFYFCFELTSQQIYNFSMKNLNNISVRSRHLMTTKKKKRKTEKLLRKEKIKQFSSLNPFPSSSFCLLKSFFPWKCSKLFTRLCISEIKSSRKKKVYEKTLIEKISLTRVEINADEQFHTPKSVPKDELSNKALMNILFIFRYALTDLHP